MPNSLKCKLKKLRHKGKISEEEFNELIDKLNGHDARLMERQYNAGYELGYEIGLAEGKQHETTDKNH